MLEARDIKKTYRMGRVLDPALQGVSLAIEEGEFAAIFWTLRQRHAREGLIDRLDSDF